MAMASPASVATLGSARPSPCCSSNTLLATVTVSNYKRNTIHVISRINFASYGYAIIPRHISNTRICKCMVTTNLIEEKGISASFNNTKDQDSDIVLKPGPKPVLNLRPNAPVRPVINDKRSSNSAADAAAVDDRDKVIESLEEVLEKAEKLETSNSNKVYVRDSTRPYVKDSNKPTTTGNRFVNTKSSAPTPYKSNAAKSVWRKGNPVTNVQKIVKEIPKVVEKEKQVVEGKKTSLTLRPQTPPVASKPLHMLQTKPAVAPPPSPPIAKKPGVVKERKQPILIDKFAGKKSSVDPIAEAVLGPTKPVKASLLSKVKEERRKKSNVMGGVKKRFKDDNGAVDDTELDVPIPGQFVRKGRKWSKASRKASKRAARLQAAKDSEPVKAEILEVGEEGMMLEELAYNLAVGESDILGYLFSIGVKPDAVQTLSKDMVKMVCKEYEVEVIEAEKVKVEEMARKNEFLDDEDLDMLEDRPPVITIMGHVDHGKTTLLDYIRKSKVVASEAGGITQGIGAYKVDVPVDGKSLPCVFLDTPGHEAFGAMRARGARVTDITIIVVAADDGVRPQTTEAIAHAKAAGVPIIIAINKIDKDGANPDRVMQELSSVGLMPEIWGGDVPMVQVSALKGENVDELLETIMLVAELQELKANPNRNAKGTVIEAGLDKSRGPVATVIVQNGTLKKGDIVVCGEAFGKMRALFDDRGGRVDEAGPSTAVQIIGLSDVPIAGDEFEVVDSLDVARERAEARATSLRDERITAKAGEGKITLSSIASAVSAGKKSGLDTHQLNIILKVDVQGSIEAIRHALQVLPQDNVTLKFILQAAGDVSASDVDLAVATEAIVIGFNVKASGSVKSYADKKNVEIRLFRVIYELIDEMRKAMEGLLELVEEQVPIGSADVRAVFSSGSGRVAGCMVTQGKVVKGCGVCVVRNGKTIHTGKIDSLRRVKEEVKEVGAGLECGIGVDDFMEWEAGDVIEAFNAVKKQRTLEEASETVTAALAQAGL